MPTSRKIINYDNINGVNLCLEIENRTGSPVCQRYIITYKSKEQKSAAWPMKPILLAVIVNFLAAYCFYIKVQDILMILSVLFFMFMFWIVYSIKSESILVIPTVGIQVTTQYVFNLHSKLIPWSDIKDIIINEVIQSNRVIYILLILVQNEGSVSLVPLFKHTKPRLMMLETIYAELHELLRLTARDESDLASGDKV